MKCKQCGEVSREDALFCRMCGKPLRDPVTLTAAFQSAAASTLEDKPAAGPGSMPVLFLPGATLNETPPAAASTGKQNTPPLPPPPEKLGPLSVGTILQNRYTILDIVDADTAATVYRVRDKQSCPDDRCAWKNAAAATRCDKCGRELQDGGTCLLEERVNRETDPDPATGAFVEHGRTYTVQTELFIPLYEPSFPSGVHLIFGMRSDVGRVRGAQGEPNEDSVLGLVCASTHESMARPSVGLFVVADGIGGNAEGEVASKQCVQTIAERVLAEIVTPILRGQGLDDDEARVRMTLALFDANQAIYQRARENLSDMGTTVTMALVIGDKLFIANVGDCRTYIFRDRKLQQLTRDHSVVGELVALGELGWDEIYTHPQRNVVVRSMGADARVEIDLFPERGGGFTLMPGDRLLLCSDGLWEMVRDEELAAHFLVEPDPLKLSHQLIASANRNGGNDNIGLIVVNVEK